MSDRLHVVNEHDTGKLGTRKEKDKFSDAIEGNTYCIYALASKVELTI